MGAKQVAHSSEQKAITQARPVLAVEKLQQRLRDAKTGEHFTVTLDERLEIQPGTFAAILGPSGCYGKGEDV